MIGIIQEMGLQVVAEYPVGPYKLDCYLPEYHVGIEADGPSHLKSRDRRRSNAIMDKYAIPVLHLADVIIYQQPDYVRQIILEFAQDFEGSTAERKATAKKYEKEHDA